MHARFQRREPPNHTNQAVIFLALRECRKIDLVPVEFSLNSVTGRGMDCLWRCVLQRSLKDARKKQVVGVVQSTLTGQSSGVVLGELRDAVSDTVRRRLRGISTVHQQGSLA